MMLYNKEDGTAQTLEDIRREFRELKANTNEFNRFTFDGFVRRYYRKRPYAPKPAKKKTVKRKK